MVVVWPGLAAWVIAVSALPSQLEARVRLSAAPFVFANNQACLAGPDSALGFVSQPWVALAEGLVGAGTLAAQSLQAPAWLYFFLGLLGP